MRALAITGISTGESLLTRGLICLVAVVLFAHNRDLTLKIKSPRTQILRAVIAGLALTFYTISYSLISASAISVLSNIDVPLLIVLGPLIGMPATPKTRITAFLSISFLIWFIYGMEPNSGMVVGLLLLSAGTFLLCFGYRFIQLSMNEENEAVTVMVPAASIAVYGIAQMAWQRHGFNEWHQPQVIYATVSGACMFLAYYATMRLYRLTNIATAEFPTLLASLIIQPIESFFLDSPVKGVYLISTIGFIVTTYLILRWQNRNLAFKSAASET